MSPYIQNDINREIDRMLLLDVIEESRASSWSNPMVAVRKPSGKIRLCIDARKLNDVTVKDAYLQPQINRILGRLTGTTFLSSIDLSDAFWQVKLEPKSRPKTAFAISGRGFFQFKRMPFGLCNSAATLCRLMDKIVGCDLEPHVFVYLDDLIIATNNFTDHIDILRKVAKRLDEAGLTISSDKSRFAMKSLKYLGYIIDKDGKKPDPDKIAAITSYATPKCVKDIRRLLGMEGWYNNGPINRTYNNGPINRTQEK